MQCTELVTGRVMWFTHDMKVPRKSPGAKASNVFQLTSDQVERRSSKKHPLFEYLQHLLNPIVKPFLDSERLQGASASQVDIQKHLEDFTRGICKLFEEVATFSLEENVVFAYRHGLNMYCKPEKPWEKYKTSWRPFVLGHKVDYTTLEHAILSRGLTRCTGV